MKQIEVDDELLDLVDENDNVVGRVNRKDYRQMIDDGSGYIRASELFIMNDQGQIWVPVRTSTKTIAPNAYDYSAAGHVASGESYVDSIIREAYEETGVVIKPEELAYVTKIKTDEIKYFRSVFLLRTDQTPKLHTDDFVSAKWLTPEELTQSIAQGHPAKIHMAETVAVLQAYLATKA